jgi:hypothetical protein
LVSERWNSSEKAASIKKTTTADLFMNHVIPSSILISMLRYDLFGMGEEPMIVHIHSITDAGLVYWIVMNCVIDLGFSDLPFGPIWETGLRISRPASLAFFRAMVTALWDRRLSGFELLEVDLCNPYKYNDDSQHVGVLQENQPSSMSIHGHGAEGAACRWEGCGTRSNSLGCNSTRGIS